MRWLRINLVSMILVILALAICPHQAEAGPGADVTIKATGLVVSVVRAPKNLVLTIIGRNLVNATWEKGVSSNYTLLLVGEQQYPGLPSENNVIYYGDATSVNFTWPITDLEVFVSGWGFAADNITYSNAYVQATTGGEGVAQIADAVMVIAGLAGQLFEILLVLGLVAIAFWRGEMLFYFISGVITLFIGLSWLDNYAGVSMALCFLAAYELFKGLMLALTSDKPSGGTSVFKSLFHKIKGMF